MERKNSFLVGEYYHVYNCGSDQRNIVIDNADANRLLKSLSAFNTTRPIGSLYELSNQKDVAMVTDPLVRIICYCLNPNHFHLLLEEIVENGISRFMRSFAGGYSKYFNITHKRKGTLFQGPFKAKLIEDNDYLLHLSAYINLNDRVHGLYGPAKDLVRSSWDEYTANSNGICQKDIILDQFSNKVDSYEKFALDILPAMLEKRPEYKELQKLL